MGNDEMFAALEAGCNRFTNSRTGRVYLIDPAQRDVLLDPGATVIGFPEESHPKKRGRKWSFLSPRNLTPTPKDQTNEG